MPKMNPIRLTGLTLLLLVLVFGPFYQGFFFSLPLLTAMTILSLGFGLWAHGRRQDRLGIGVPGGWAGSLLLALAAVYLLQFGWAAYARGNLEWVLRVVTAWMAVVMIREESTPTTRRYLGWTLMTLGAIVAVLGLLEYSGFFQQGAAALADTLKIKSLGVGQRIYSVLQYPNAAAALMLTVMLVGNALILGEESLRRRLVLSTLSGLIALGFFFTLSRGILVVAPVAILLMLIGLPRGQILPSLMLMVSAMGVPVLIGMKTIAAAGGAGNHLLVILWALLASAAAALATWGATRLSRLPSRTLWLGMGTLLAVAGIAIGGLLATRPIDQVLPPAITRLLDINLETQSAQSRLEFTADALRAFKDQPWGYGGTGWDRTYRRYQQVNYVTREVHNHYAQTLVEAGALGLIALVGALGAALWTGFRSRTDEPLRWTMTSAGMLLALHAFLDIDLSYFYLWLLMWGLLAAGLPPQAVPVKQEKRFVWPATLASTVVVCLVSLSLAVGANAFLRAEDAIIARDGRGAVAAARTAVQWDPINSQYLRLVSAQANLERAVALDKYNASLWSDLARIREGQGDLAGAREAAVRALENQPMHLDRYVTLAGISGQLIDAGLVKKDRAGVLAEAESLLALGRQLDERSAVAAPRQHRYPYTRLEWTPPMHLALGKAQMLTGDLEGAEQHLRKAVDGKEKELAKEASLWLHALYTQQNNDQEPRNLPAEPDRSALRSALYRALLDWRP